MICCRKRNNSKVLHHVDVISSNLNVHSHVFSYHDPQPVSARSINTPRNITRAHVCDWGWRKGSRLIYSVLGLVITSLANRSMSKVNYILKTKKDNCTIQGISNTKPCAYTIRACFAASRCTTTASGSEPPGLPFRCG